MLKSRAKETIRRARRVWDAASTTAARPARPAAAPAVKAAPPQAPDVAPRFDPLPVLHPLPPAKYVFVVGAIPRNFGGRTASILHKCRLLKEIGGVDSTIVTLNYSSEVDDIAADLRRRGLLVDGVEIVNLHDYFDEQSTGVAEPVHHDVDEPGMDKIRDPDQEVYRYYENGVYRLYKRFDHEGRLIVRDWFNENRGRTRRDEFNLNGTIRRTTYMDLHHNKPRQEIFYRADGTPYMNKWLRVNPTTMTSSVERITMLDEQGAPYQVLLSNVELIQSYLDRLIGDQHCFLSVESRRSDGETLTYVRPNVKHVYVLHNPHIAPPFDDLAAVRPSYKPLLDQRDAHGAVVFLTNAQRADAEAVYGEQDNFAVIPHPVAPVPQVPFSDRDPDLVVMLARLDAQKRIPHAVAAFAHVVKARPSARLEIYGQGPEEGALQQLIDESGLRGSVRLMGYTKNPAEVYERAACSLLTSRFEGFGLVLLESLSHGCPVVSYDVKYGPADIVADGVNGFLVGSAMQQQMARRVVELLDDEPLRRRLSENAAQVRTEFSEETFVARWSELFHHLDEEGWADQG
ncbi:glycosyltransferase [Microlunatus flavus]|uniref:glycosyltransferase n=1 Tax=Microlunatus flavus TaxID=1036181 RepID=UPI00111428AE|nr:glycosyltransferase [Microlunatus flavus]